MKYRSKVFKIVAASFVLANFLVIGQMFGSDTIPKAAALTPAQCKSKYDGKGQGRGVSDENKLTTKQYDDYKKSECAKGSKATCSVNGSSNGFTISCKSQQSGSSANGDESPVGGDYNKRDCEQGLEGNCELVDLIVQITNIISGLAATVIVAMIIVGGIQYSMAGAEAAKVQAAKQKITNALLALLLLIFGFSIIQWLVPGGLI